MPPLTRDKGEKLNPTDEEYIKALNYVIILDAGSEKDNTAFNDVVHRLIDLTNGKNGNFSNLNELFNLIKKINVYYFNDGEVVRTTFENVAGSDRLHFDEEEFDK